MQQKKRVPNIPTVAPVPDYRPDYIPIPQPDYFPDYSGKQNQSIIKLIA